MRYGYAERKGGLLYLETYGGLLRAVELTSEGRVSARKGGVVCEKR